MLKALWRAFVDGFIDNNEKVASSQKHIQFKTRVQKPYPIYDQSGWKTVPFWAAHIYIARMRDYDKVIDKFSTNS